MVNNIYNLTFFDVSEYSELLAQDCEILANLFNECSKKLHNKQPIYNDMRDIWCLLNKNTIIKHLNQDISCNILELLSRTNSINSNRS